MKHVMQSVGIVVIYLSIMILRRSAGDFRDALDVKFNKLFRDYVIPFFLLCVIATLVFVGGRGIMQRMRGSVALIGLVAANVLLAYDFIAVRRRIAAITTITEKQMARLAAINYASLLGYVVITYIVYYSIIGSGQ